MWRKQGLFWRWVNGAEPGLKQAIFSLFCKDLVGKRTPYPPRDTSNFLADLHWTLRGQEFVRNGRKSADRRTRTMPAKVCFTSNEMAVKVVQTAHTISFTLNVLLFVGPKHLWFISVFLCYKHLCWTITNQLHCIKIKETIPVKDDGFVMAQHICL